MFWVGGYCPNFVTDPWYSSETESEMRICCVAEADRWLGMGRGCALQQGAPCQSGSSLESLWDILPAQSSQPWAKEPGSSAITSLIRDLSLGDSAKTSPLCLSTTTAPSQTPAAPPSKRQCRSLSFSDEFGSFRSCWRPQGSRVWTAVEKRRCHSGGSVRGGSALSGSNLPVMQRSSSFSLPSRCSLPFDGPLDLPLFTQRLPLHHQFTASPVSPTSPPAHHQHSPYQHFLRPLSLSHEQISLPELQTEEASEASSPDSTPELSRRAAQRSSGKGCLSRSRSQPCVIDKKISMKRRRPEDAQEQRPSLDLAKMTQNLQTFQSLSCPGFSVADSFPVPSFENRPELDFNNRSAQPRLEPRPEETEDLSYGEDSDSACSVDSRSGSPDVANDTKHTLWKGAMQQRDIFQLGGELDLDQIERN
uniref:Family with sequence similarity 53 member B n=1 Tax=Neogobius melanostomus TaxID=47308 RepID=A0A8C6U620_9GOBI